MKIQWNVFFVLFFLLPIMLFAQDWGEISEEELQLKSISEDPEANAVILFDRAEIKISPDWELEMEVHRRIKILSEAGKNYANIRIRSWHKDNIYNLKASSYSANGEEYELDDDEIFEEHKKKSTYTVFAIPGVEVGSVIEYKYLLISKYIGALEPWLFQSDEFTRLSEVTVYMPAGFTYSVLSKNLSSYNIKDTNEVVFDPYNIEKKCTKFHWRGVDIPGIKDEPFMTAKADYYALALFQIVGYKDRYNNISYAKEWNDIARSLWKKLKGYVLQDGDSEDLAISLTAKSDSDKEKAKVLYDFVRSKIKTTGNVAVYSDDLKEPEEALEDKSASSNAKNILLINMLKHVGLNAQPLFISTRSHGEINTKWVQTQQFNRIIIRVKLGKKYFYLNPGIVSCPFGFLTPEYAVNEGLLLQEAKAKIINIRAAKVKSGVKINTEIELDESGTLYCKSKIEYSGNDAMMKRLKLKDKDREDQEKYVENMVQNFYSEAEIDTFQYTDIDSIEKSLQLYMEYTIPDYLENAGSLALLEVPLLLKQSKNPFVREKRDFPVDFKYTTNHMEVIEIKIPSSMKISEKPTRAKAKINKLNFYKMYFVDDNNIEIRRSYRLSRKQFQPHEYSKLKQVYEKIVQSDQDKIVLTNN